MNIPTCYRCPERNRDYKRCVILAAKMATIRGCGLTSVSFKCDTRQQLFSPGDEVTATLHDRECDRLLEFTGIVMRTKKRKVLIFCEGTDQDVLWAYPDVLRKTGNTHSVCADCGAPKGKKIQIKRSASEPIADWECGSFRFDDNGSPVGNSECRSFTETAPGEAR